VSHHDTHRATLDRDEEPGIGASAASSSCAARPSLLLRQSVI